MLSTKKKKNHFKYEDTEMLKERGWKKKKHIN